MRPSSASSSEGGGPETDTGASNKTVTLNCRPATSVLSSGIEAVTFATDAGEIRISCAPPRTAPLPSADATRAYVRPAKPNTATPCAPSSTGKSAPRPAHPAAKSEPLPGTCSSWTPSSPRAAAMAYAEPPISNASMPCTLSSLSNAPPSKAAPTGLSETVPPLAAGAASTRSTWTPSSLLAATARYVPPSHSKASIATAPPSASEALSPRLATGRSAPSALPAAAAAASTRSSWTPPSAYEATAAYVSPPSSNTATSAAWPSLSEALSPRLATGRSAGAAVSTRSSWTPLSPCEATTAYVSPPDSKTPTPLAPDSSRVELSERVASSLIAEPLVFSRSSWAPPPPRHAATAYVVLPDSNTSTPTGACVILSAPMGASVPFSRTRNIWAPSSYDVTRAYVRFPSSNMAGRWAFRRPSVASSGRSSAGASTGDAAPRTSMSLRMGGGGTPCTAPGEDMLASLPATSLIAAPPAPGAAGAPA